MVKESSKKELLQHLRSIFPHKPEAELNDVIAMHKNDAEAIQSWIEGQLDAPEDNWEKVSHKKTKKKGEEVKPQQQQQQQTKEPETGDRGRGSQGFRGGEGRGRGRGAGRGDGRGAGSEGRGGRGRGRGGRFPTNERPQALWDLSPSKEATTASTEGFTAESTTSTTTPAAPVSATSAPASQPVSTPSTSVWGERSYARIAGERHTQQQQTQQMQPQQPTPQTSAPAAAAPPAAAPSVSDWDVGPAQTQTEWVKADSIDWNSSAAETGWDAPQRDNKASQDNQDVAGGWGSGGSGHVEAAPAWDTLPGDAQAWNKLTSPSQVADLQSATKPPSSAVIGKQSPAASQPLSSSLPQVTAPQTASQQPHHSPQQQPQAQQQQQQQPQLPSYFANQSNEPFQEMLVWKPKHATPTPVSTIEKANSDKLASDKGPVTLPMHIENISLDESTFSFGSFHATGEQDLGSQQPPAKPISVAQNQPTSTNDKNLTKDADATKAPSKAGYWEPQQAGTYGSPHTLAPAQEQSNVYENNRAWGLASTGAIPSQPQPSYHSSQPSRPTPDLKGKPDSSTASPASSAPSSVPASSHHSSKHPSHYHHHQMAQQAMHPSQQMVPPYHYAMPSAPAPGAQYPNMFMQYSYMPGYQPYQTLPPNQYAYNPAPKYGAPYSMSQGKSQSQPAYPPPTYNPNTGHQAYMSPSNVAPSYPYEQQVMGMDDVAGYPVGVTPYYTAADTQHLHGPAASHPAAAPKTQTTASNQPEYASQGFGYVPNAPYTASQRFYQ